MLGSWSMKLDTAKAIIIGALIVAAGFFFNSMYERQLAYNICTKMFKEHPASTYRDEKAQKEMCKWHVYVLGKNRPEFLLNFKK